MELLGKSTEECFDEVLGGSLMTCTGLVRCLVKAPGLSFLLLVLSISRTYAIVHMIHTNQKYSHKHHSIARSR